MDDLNRALEMLNAVPNAREQNWSEAQAYARNGLGIARSMLGDFSSAFREFYLSIDLQPENGWVYFSRAQARERMARQSSSARQLQKVAFMYEAETAPFKRHFAETKIRKLVP